MIVWGLVSMATIFMAGQTSFYIFRIVLGIAEAGFFPGVVLYLTYWIPSAERARTGALFMTAAPVSVVIGAPISQALLTLHGTLGLHGWQWLFLIEGLPAVVLGVIAWWYLTDRPEDAAWLRADQREWLSGVMARERAERRARQHGSDLRSVLSGKVFLLCLVYFLNTMVTYGLFLWLPRILSDASGFGPTALSAITMIPFGAALIGMVLIGRHSDRTRERKRHVAVCALLGATGLVLASVFHANVPMLVLSFTLCQIGQRSIVSVFWAIPPIFLGTAAAAGIGLINAIGNLGGFVGPSVMGWLRGATGSYSAGLLVLAGVLIAESILVMTLRLPPPQPGRS
jgi:ACS family tartrate transporter-like MFS transporter